MYTVEFINQHGLAELTNQLGIKVREYGDIVVLNYDQIESPKSHPVVMECRSLALYKDDYSVANRAFPRFFNYGEVPEVTGQVNFANAICYEKLDGSLIKVWKHRNGLWYVSTRSMLYGEGEHNCGKQFRDLVLNSFHVNGDEFQAAFDNVDSQCTYVFEWTSPLNRIVTPYKDDQMVLTAVFDNKTGEEYSYPSLVQTLFVLKRLLNVRLVKVFDVSSAEAAIQAAKSLEGLEEGFVIQYLDNKVRIKLKNPGYVAVHHLRENRVLSQKRIIEVILLGEDSEYLDYFPEDKPQFQPFVDVIDEIKDNIRIAWEQCKQISDQKEFALAVKDYPFSAYLFQAKKKNLCAINCFNEGKINHRIDLVLKWSNRG